ncbi:hypothetical protein EYF80_013841 [Liparis tanakae]|uniref:Uncharacterized protein n=1 Tax=Liparis tanakae TaxID=230148 RepID=A0A4Z2IDQ3_9TELE|nr:hypothetical protein EYF80_013841 [Liparis tanakae]
MALEGIYVVFVFLGVSLGRIFKLSSIPVPPSTWPSACLCDHVCSSGSSRPSASMRTAVGGARVEAAARPGLRFGGSAERGGEPLDTLQ